MSDVEEIATDALDELLGEVDQTVATLRAEAEELRTRGWDVDDVAEQLEHRADRLAEVAEEADASTDADP